MPQRLHPKSANNQLATAFCETPPFSEFLIYAKSYESFFYYTDNKYYRKLDTFEIKKIILRFCETQYPRQGFTATQLGDVLELIKFKLERVVKKEESNLIAFNDCLYDTRTHTTIPFSPERICTWFIPHNLSEISTPTPHFTKFIETSVVEAKSHTTPDFELINLIQEMMGYLLLDSFYATGAFFLYGTGSNGKSVLTNLIEHIFGDEYVSAMSLADFNKPFAVGDIINKRVNISTEEDERFVSGKMFKVLVTGESLRGEHKFGAGYKMRSTCKFLFATNKLPTFDGLDYGLKRRIFIIPFYRKFSPKEQDKRLIEKLIPEIPGIIGWALEGAKRLEANNFTFSQSKASLGVFNEFEEEMSSAIMFFNENYVVDKEGKTPKADLYNHYLNWSKENGKRGMYSRNRFNKELMDNISGLEERIAYIDKTVRVFNCLLSDRESREANKEEMKEIAGDKYNMFI